MSGPAFYDTLHAPRPPAVFMTAHDGARMHGARDSIGAHALLTKPFPGETLVEAIFKATATA